MKEDFLRRMLLPCVFSFSPQLAEKFADRTRHQFVGGSRQRNPIMFHHFYQFILPAGNTCTATALRHHARFREMCNVAFPPSLLSPLPALPTVSRKHAAGKKTLPLCFAATVFLNRPYIPVGKQNQYKTEGVTQAAPPSNIHSSRKTYNYSTRRRTHPPTYGAPRPR